MNMEETFKFVDSILKKNGFRVATDWKCSNDMDYAFGDIHFVFTRAKDFVDYGKIYKGLFVREVHKHNGTLKNKSICVGVNFWNEPHSGTCFKETFIKFRIDLSEKTIEKKIMKVIESYRNKNLDVEIKEAVDKVINNKRNDEVIVLKNLSQDEATMKKIEIKKEHNIKLYDWEEEYLKK